MWLDRCAWGTCSSAAPAPSRASKAEVERAGNKLVRSSGVVHEVHQLGVHRLVLAGVWVGTRAETDEPSPAPTEPTLTLGKSVGTDEVVLTWTSTTSPYVASRDTDPNPNDFTPTVLASGLSGSTFSDPGLTNGINYYYLVADSNTPPKVYGRSANAGLPGDSVTFTGVGFATLMSDNKVLIAGEPAMITGATTTSLTFTIPATWVSGQTIVVTPRGANIGGTIYDIGTQGLSNISTVGVDSLGTKFVSDLGTTGTSDRVFTFNPSTGVR